MLLTIDSNQVGDKAWPEEEQCTEKNIKNLKSRVSKRSKNRYSWYKKVKELEGGKALLKK